MQYLVIHFNCPIGESLDYEYDEYYDEVCTTISGSKSNEPCVFPFIFQGRQFNNCITGSKRTNPWCATQVDAFGNYIRGHWGYCGVNCPLGVVAINTGSIFPKSSLHVFQISKYLDLPIFQIHQLFPSLPRKPHNILQ